MSLTSEELNLLIFHYLKESGFSHSAFVFQEEIIRKCEISEVKIPVGALVSVVQKGLQYMDVEAHINENGEEQPCSAPFTLLGAHKCEIQPVIEELEDFVRPSKIAKVSESPIQTQPKKIAVPTPAAPTPPPQAVVETPPAKKEPESIQIASPEVHPEPPTPTTVELDPIIEEEPKGLRLGHDYRDRPYKVIIEDDATVLLGHESEVFLCSWNPAFPTYIATGSNDGAGRVWRLPQGSKSEKILSHYMGINSIGQNRDIAAMDWHPKGTVLATGSYDGYVRQFTHNGWLRFQADEHSTPVLAVKFNPRGNLILSGGMDMSARIWCSATGEQLQQLKWHTDAVVDISWKCEDIFSTCSNDGLICVGQFEEAEPMRTFSEHTGPVNSIKWDPTGNLLASCSDDMTVKIWTMEKSSSLITMKGHAATISTVRWSPKPTGPSAIHLLATASDDKTVCLWDTSTGSLLFRLAEHTLRVSSITFSPDSKYLASSAFDSAIHVFSTENGKLVKSFLRQGEIFAVEWNPEGDCLAACFADSSVAVFDLSK